MPSNKIAVANEWLDVCAGCEMAIVGLHEKIIDLLEEIEIKYSPVLVDTKEIPEVDIGLVTGGIRNEKQIEDVKEIREKSDILVAVGTCAVAGGVQGLGNLFTKEELLREVYGDGEGTDNPDNQPPSEGIPDLTDGGGMVSEYIEVDYEIPGCPPPSELILDFLVDLLDGKEPELSDSTVCDECPFEYSGKKLEKIERWLIEKEADADDSCLLDQGILCLGGATVAGCKAPCPESGVPCFGCSGPHPEEGDQATEVIRILSTELDLREEYPEVDLDKIKIEDITGSFYMFSLASSILAEKLRRKTNAR